MPLESVLGFKAVVKGTISWIYGVIDAINPQSLNNLRTIWEQDLDLYFAESQWASILGRVHSSSPCARYGLIQFKIVHRLHFTKEKLARIYPNTDPT